LTRAGIHALRQRRGSGDVGVDVAVLLLVDDVEQALPAGKVLEVEVVGLLVEQRGADHALQRPVRRS
jgi:hypothetical protein